MNTEIKRYADSGDLQSLKYIFVDALDVDPTFVRYEEEYNYCRSIPGLLESHVELTPFKENSADWNEEYWINLKMDLLKNFSDRRMSHMREVAKVLLADKIQRILAERATNDVVQNKPVVKEEFVPVQKTERADFKLAESAPKTSSSKAAEQARRLEEERRKLEAENRKQEDRQRREARERAARREQQRREQERTETQVGGGTPKKVVGIVLAAVAVAVVLVLLLK